MCSLFIDTQLNREKKTPNFNLLYLNSSAVHKRFFKADIRRKENSQTFFSLFKCLKVRQIRVERTDEQVDGKSLCLIGNIQKSNKLSVGLLTGSTSKIKPKKKKKEIYFKPNVEVVSLIMESRMCLHHAKIIIIIFLLNLKDFMSPI